MHETWFDPDDPPPFSTVIPNEVASLQHTTVTQLPPLYDSVDADTLQDVFAHSGSGLKVFTFAYAGYLITVADDGRITFRSDS